MAAMYHTHLQRRVLQEWLLAAEEEKRGRAMYQQAHTHHTSAILTKVGIAHAQMLLVSGMTACSLLDGGDRCRSEGRSTGMRKQDGWSQLGIS